MTPLARRHIEDQVVVITGASSGIGLASARMAARRGAKVVLTARSESKLDTIVQQLRQRGLEATRVVADVAEPEQLREVARVAEERYGGIDTWVNNAATSIFGPVQEVDLEDVRRLFEVNFFGVVHGCRAALPVLRRTGGGVIVNVGSLLSDRSVSLQAFYSATKHAVKAYTDALRMELERDDEPIAVTLIKPTSVNTPYAFHGMNLTDVQPTLPSPVYAPEVVARAIVDVCERPKRDVYVGGASRVLSIIGAIFPRLSDFVSDRVFTEAQMGGPSNHAPWTGTLYEPDEGEPPRVEGDLHKHVARSSLYTRARLHPVKAGALTALGIGAAWAAGRMVSRWT